MHNLGMLAWWYACGCAPLHPRAPAPGRAPRVAGMDVRDFSCAKQWEPYAHDALRRSKAKGRRGLRHALISTLTWPLTTAASLPPLSPFFRRG